MSGSSEQIFVSSTCFDLVDVRAEVRNFLLEVGVTPLLSEYPEFGAGMSMNSIEVCLEQIRRSDLVIFFVSSRYGSDLAIFDYPGLSATHLEYNTAIATGKRIHFFVRDTVHADWQSWKKNGRSPSFKCNSINKPEDIPKIFEWISDHENRREKEDDNWIIPFRDSLTVKEWIRNSLGKLAPSAVIGQALRGGFIPPLIITWATNPNFNLGIQNLGMHSVLGAKASAKGWIAKKEIGPITPGKTPSALFEPAGKGAKPPKEIQLTFITAQGQHVQQTYTISSESGYATLSDISLISYQVFTVGANPISVSTE